MKRLLCWSLLIILLSALSFGALFQDIAYISDRSGYWEIWKTSSNDPSDCIQVTQLNGNGTPDTVKWSPDGKWLAFDMNREIYVIDSDGHSTPICLTSTGSPLYLYRLDFGVENDWVYYIKVWPATRSEIWRVNINTLITEPVNQRANTTFQTFDVSYCGNYRVEMRENGCCWTPNMYTVLHDLINHTETIILPRDGHAEWTPRFNKEGDKIVYSQASQCNPPQGLWVMNRDGTDVRQITFPSGSIVHKQPVWSPDSREILYQTNENGNDDLYILHLEEGVSIPFIATQSNEKRPDWYYGPNRIEAAVEIHPDTLNLKSKGKWISVYIDLPGEYDVNDILDNTIKLHYNDEYLAMAWGEIQGDLYMAKFNRSQVKSLLKGISGEITFMVTGMVVNTEFAGMDTIQVKN